MLRRRSPVVPFLVLAALYACWFGGRRWYEASIRQVTLRPSKASYLHYELVEVSLFANDPKLKARWRAKPPVVVVTKDGAPVTTIAGMKELTLREDPGGWRGLWPVPWNAAPGRYELTLLGSGDLGERLERSAFTLGRRKPAPLPRGFSAFTLETDKPLADMKVVGPDGKTTDWTGLLDWAQYIGADAFWMVGGQTPGVNPGEVWVTTNLPMIPKVARECHRRGLKFGVYAMCYLTMSKEQVGGYEYASEVDGGKPVPTRAISLRDDKRWKDVAALLKQFRDIPEVDFLGLDYIRNALGGYELAEPFFAEMQGVHAPPEWPRLSSDEKMVWLARKKIMRRDLDFIDAWQWWRAHKVGTIVRRIKDELGDSKPLWAFTLTWDKGWNHGQDPVMMNDAGVDADALMLYEADKAQFEAIVKDFRSYVKRGDVQLVAGEIIDWPLHQRDPAGPREMYRRVTKAVDTLYPDGPAYGVFFHDAQRALHGRLGEWGTKGWLDEARRAAEHLRSLDGVASSAHAKGGSK